jgi:hypothetical protein
MGLILLHCSRQYGKAIKDKADEMKAQASEQGWVETIKSQAVIHAELLKEQATEQARLIQEKLKVCRCQNHLLPFL